MIGAVKVEHDYETILVPKSDHNRSENRPLIVSESLTLTVTNGQTTLSFFSLESVMPSLTLKVPCLPPSPFLLLSTMASR
jgi:hypothetical protein